MGRTITINRGMTRKAAEAVAGTLGAPKKMPGTSYGISAFDCITGSKLAEIEGSVCFKCYAREANYNYPSVAVAHANRFAGLESPEWTDAMVSMLTHMHTLDKHGQPRKNKNGPIDPGWHRWHDSGDLQSVKHLANICEVARRTPMVKHWLPTREGAFLKQYLAQGGVVPANLVIRVSATMVDGPAPQFWSTTSGVHNATVPAGHICPASKQDGMCGACRACWSADVPFVSYPLH